MSTFFNKYEQNDDAILKLKYSKACPIWGAKILSVETIVNTMFLRELSVTHFNIFHVTYIGNDGNTYMQVLTDTEYNALLQRPKPKELFME